MGDLAESYFTASFDIKLSKSLKKVSMKNFTRAQISLFDVYNDL